MDKKTIYKAGTRVVVMLDNKDGSPQYWSDDNLTCVDILSDLDGDESNAILIEGDYEYESVLPGDMFIIESLGLLNRDDGADLEYEGCHRWKVVEDE